MNFTSCMRAAVSLLIVMSTLQAEVVGGLKIALIRISFEKGDFPGFTGDGDFLMSPTDICGDYIIDPPPHNKNYFNSHLRAVNNYFRTVSHNIFGIDLDESNIYPASNDSSYQLTRSMNYYNELGMEIEHEKRITTLLKDAIEKAYEVDQIDFNNYDLIAVIHPGLGQDFKLPFLDPTPEDIPSTFVDSRMIEKYFDKPLVVGNSTVNNGLILPESQNHPLMDPSIFSALSNPCDIQYSITGTWALMIGFAVGLPPLWNIDTGESGIGIFGLMDQGSNNGRGMIPSIPNPWTRIHAGWENPTEYSSPQTIKLTNLKKNSIAKIFLNDSEYFLIENRNNWFRQGVDIDSARLAVWEKTKIYPSYIDVLFDSSGVIKNEYGVVTKINNYNMGMPASGFLIWHIDESRISRNINSYKINYDKLAKGIDLEEADGAQDIGYVSNLLTDPSSGYWGDMWFNSNNQYFRSNTINNLEFSNYTFPNTQTNDYYISSIRLDNFSKPDTSSSFDLSYSSNRKFFTEKNKSILFQWDVDNDGILDFIGSGDSLWWSKDLEILNQFKKTLSDDVQLCVVKKSEPLSLALIERTRTTYIVSWYNFDSKIENFIKSWDVEIASNDEIILLGAEGGIIYIEQSHQFFKIDTNGALRLQSAPELTEFYGPDSSKINLSVDNLMNYNFLPKNNSFKSFSLADLDLDNSIDIIGIDTTGNIYAFDINFKKKNGFPVAASALGTVLVSDITGDIYPEIIFEQTDRSMIVMDNNGREVSSSSLPVNSHLQSIGVYKNKKAIILSNHLEFFKESKGSVVYNEWTYQYGSPDFSRSVKINISGNVDIAKLLNKDLTYAYPNPSYGENITIRLNVGKYETIEVDIYDIAGFKETSLSKLPSENSSGFESVVEIPWNIQSVESGIYFAKVKVYGKTGFDQKLIKMSVIK
ncbi:MAG: T9SS type A sorting domain-containing protein [Candidatus Neomarinimicrobiota bacterium]|nr:MAG: T9SS C-terminal target domain-containing protein [bacterium]